MAEKSSELETFDKSANFDAENSALENLADDSAKTNADNQTDETDSSGATEETGKIRGQIEETRREMSETIDAIQEKLSFSNISEQVKEQVSEQISGAYETVKETVYDSTIGKAGNFMKNISQELRESSITRMAGKTPFPLFLIGLGVGLLAINSYQKNTSAKYKKYRYTEGSADNVSSQKSSQNKVSDTVSGAYESVGKAANSAYEGVSSAASGAVEKVGDLGTQARGQYEYYLEENPLAVGAVALALGAAVGLSIPSTRYESELMGEAHENLMSKAEEAARGAFDKVQQVAEQAKDVIAGEVKKQTQA